MTRSTANKPGTAGKASTRIPKLWQQLPALGDKLVAYFDRMQAGQGWAMVVAACLNGVLLSRAFSPVDLFFVLFLCVPVMLFMLWHAPNWRRAFAYGWWTGFGFFLFGLMWTGYSFTQQGPGGQVPVALAPLAVFALAAVLAVYIGLVFALAALLRPKGAAMLGRAAQAHKTLRPAVYIKSAVYFAAIWTLGELARGYLFTGFPWHLMSAVWAGWLAPLQASYLFGVYGLSFVTMLAAGLPAASFVSHGGARPVHAGHPDGEAQQGEQAQAERRRHEGAHSQSGLKQCAGMLAGLILVSSITLYGALRLASQPTDFHLSVPIRLVQAAVPQRELWYRELWGEHFDKHLRLSRSNSRTGKAEGVRLVIWPESGIQEADVDRPDSLRRWQISRLLERGSYALVGVPRYENDGQGFKFYNSMLAVNSDRDVMSRYDKNHLVPFGEYMPFAGLFEAVGLQHLTGGSAYSAGSEKIITQLPGIPSFSTIICYEAIFPGESFPENARPEWLLNITNDGWFGNTEGPYQHFALTRMRAVEEGLPVVRNAISGISAVIDPLGRTVKKLDVGQSAILDSVLPKAVEAPYFTTKFKKLLLLIVTCLIIVYATYERNNIKNIYK